MCSNIPAFKEQTGLGINDLIVPENTLEAFAESIEKLLRESEVRVRYVQALSENDPSHFEFVDIFMRFEKMKIPDISKIVNHTYEFWCRKHIKNREFTILSSNCIGGIIYHRLGMRFLSPTINMFIRQFDFIKLIQNPEHYFKQPLMFDNQLMARMLYPVAKLDDITLYFNHSKSQEEAENDWNRRKERIVWDNMFIIMYERDNITRQQILQLEDIKCKRLIVLTEKKDNTDISYVKYIKRSNKRRENDQTFLDFDSMWLRTFEKQWDFVSWLNA